LYPSHALVPPSWGGGAERSLAHFLIYG
jgi:hypothetical protein